MPANDNWASAFVIVGAAGSTTGDNTGATAEAGEPANAGRTVWFKWTAPGNMPVYFATWQNPFDHPLRTTLHVYTGSAVNALTQVGYLPGGSWAENYSYWERGSMVAFDAAAGTDYYIRVDGVGGAQGPFPLVWDSYDPVWAGNCGGTCQPQVGGGWECVGKAVCGSIVRSSGSSANQTISFGAMPNGKYTIGYCGGAFAVIRGGGAGFSGPWWTMDATDDTADGTINGPLGPIWTILYNAAGPATAQLSGRPAGGEYTSAQHWVEARFRCVSATFEHDGGGSGTVDMALQLDHNQAGGPLFNNTNGSVDGSPNPTFALYRRYPVFQAVSACASWTVVGSQAAVSFAIRNPADVDWSGVTVTLLATGGVGAPSAPQAGITVLANSVVNTQVFTFNASAANVIASLKFSCAKFPADLVIDFNLSPVFTVDTVVLSAGAGACAPFITKLFSFTIRNSGYWTVNPDVTVDLGGVKQLVDTVGGCHGHTSMTISPGDVNCINGTQNPLMRYGATGVTAPATLTVAVSHRGASYGSFTFPITTV